MISQEINTCGRYTPMPLSFLINAANSFDCDIFIQSEGRHRVNVKSYDEMIRNLSTRTKSLLFFFNGADEADAQKRIERIFRE